MKPTKTEAEIRDHLAQNLDLIEPGLVLEKKEKHLRNDGGAAGFVDLFARDQKGRIVIIEIKKTNATAREAVQELVKYAALVRAKSLIKSTEYRLIVLSVEWHELLTPFSEFFHVTRYDLRGGKIVLGHDGLPELIEWVEPLPKQAERSFSRRHFIWEYDSLEKARAGANIGVARMQEIGLKNFIFAIITLAEGSEGITHLVYFAQQEEAPEFYWEIINRRFSAEELEEFNEWLEEFEEPSDVLGELADKAWDASADSDSLYSVMNPDGAQISHPEKAQHWLSEEVAKEVEVIRVGLLDEADLSDRALLAELRGTQGGSTYYVDTSASLASKPESDALLAASDEVFFFNPAWRSALRSVVGYARHKGATAIELKAFSNDDILKTLVWAPFDAQKYLPVFMAKVSFADRDEAFLGVIDWNGHCPDWESVIDTYFEGDAESLMWHRHFGSVRSLNGEVMEALGLSYGVLHTPDMTKADSAVPIVFQGLTFSERKGTRKRYYELLSCGGFISQAIGNEANFDYEFSTMLSSRMAG